MKPMTKLDIETRKQELEAQLTKLTVYEGLRKQLEEKINWDYCQYHEADEEHDGTWFTAPDMDSWKYNEYMSAMEILTALDSVVLK